MSPNLLTTHSHIHLISEAHLLRKLKNLCRRAAASLSYKYPARRICCGSDRVLGLLEAGWTVWSWTLHEASVLSRASCAPWEEGAAAFHTLPHIHCTCARLLHCVVFTARLHILWFFHTFLTNCFQMTQESFSSFCITLLYKDECLRAPLIYSQCQNSLSRHELGCTCLHHLTQNVSVIYHSRKVMHDHPLTPGNGRLYLWAREHLLSCQGQPPGISIVQYTTVWVR